MNGHSLSSLIGRLRDTVRPGDGQTLSDADLLRRWLKGRDEAAFELLVWRHGRLVLSVCRRLLPNSQDAEDAFQATFLVLVRKAAGIARGQAVASWLHTVALRIATQARMRTARVAQPEAIEFDQLPGEADGPGDLGDLKRVLDEEVSRLPEKYRVPFVLCHLDGKTNEEAAREMGCPLGTVLSRLSRARERLRERLTRRGVAPAALAACTLVGEVVSAELVSSTARVAAAGAGSAPVAALAEGVIQTMFLAKVKASLAIVLTVAIVGVGGGFGYHTAGAQDEGGGGGAKTPAGDKPTGTDDLPPETRELLKVVEALKRELQATQDRADVLRAKLTKVQDDLGLKRTNPPRKDYDRGSGKAPSGPGFVPAGQRNPVIEDEKDLLELLKARVAAREAEVKSSKALLEESKYRLRGAEDANRRTPGSISRDDIGAARITVDKYRSEMAVKEAELLEAQILVRQSERRLQRLTESGAATRTLEQRVEELERLVHELQRQKGRGTFESGKKGSAPPGK